MKKIITVVGARPNFIKIAPIHKAFKKYPDKVAHKICHTGQHFDENMSKIFFEDLELPKPDFYLGVGSGSHAVQTARIMIEFEKVLENEKPDLIIVPGDVNSTMACSIVASKIGIKIGHVEAGLRSFDREMPEEINRIVTDVLSDFLFVTEKSGLKNLKNEGIDSSKIYFVGNTMIDSLNLESYGYILVTFHRPSNVDEKVSLSNLLLLLNTLAEKRFVVFPIHPRTRINIEKFKLNHTIHSNILLLDPVGYIDFLCLAKNAELVITDSGGIQEETTYLEVQCITVRKNTERPVTVEIGTNHLVGTDFKKVEETAMSVLDGNIKKGIIPELWDGKAAERIVNIILNKKHQ
jgi:UDP-N-acetylglucosamine 2-epimerase (non-hydrolysing)